MRDISQLRDFAKLTIANGQPLAIFAPLMDVATFVLKYPEDARKILTFMEKVEGDTWKQKTQWTNAATTRLKAVGADDPKSPPKSADVAIIGAGLSAGHILRNFADALAKDGVKPRSVLVLEKDSKEKREHAASLRNAGIVCTAMDYVFDIDEAVGGKPVERIREALKISEPEAVAVYKSMMKVMHDATATIQAFLKDKKVDIEMKPFGGLDVATTEEELEAFRTAAKQAVKLGMDWEAVDAAMLKATYGIESKEIVGAEAERLLAAPPRKAREGALRIREGEVEERHRGHRHRGDRRAPEREGRRLDPRDAHERRRGGRGPLQGRHRRARGVRALPLPRSALLPDPHHRRGRREEADEARRHERVSRALVHAQGRRREVPVRLG
jgi:hypothetical protein